MGQEVSVPASQADSLEEQARAPPSTSNQDHPSRGRGASGTGRASRKIMGAMFRQNGNNGTTSAINQNNHADFEQRESSRAAALGGHIYMNDGCSDEFVNGNTIYPQNESQSHLSESGRDLDAVSTTPSSTNIGLPQQNSTEHAQTSFAASQLPQHSVVGMLFEKQQNAKKGLFANRGTRGVINTMRNLTLTGRKQKEATDWEKQWDEDDDDDDSDGIDVAETNSAPQHLAVQVSPLKLPPQSSSLQQSPGSPEGGQVALITPKPSDLLSENSLQSDISEEIPVSPPRNLHQHPCITPSSAEEQSHMNVALHQMAEDLLSKPLEGNIPSADHHILAENDNLDWDIDYKVAADEGDDKPCVKMFMPMLRVLGKGSFGKVRLLFSIESYNTLDVLTLFVGCVGTETRRKRYRPAVCNENLEENTLSQATTN